MTRVLVALAVLALAGCANPVREPANLDTHKREIREYVKSGAYDRELARIAGQAQRWIEQRVKRKADGERLAVVLDLDETLFLNWSRMDASDFTYVHADWDRWVAQAAAPAIEPVREVFRTAQRNAVEVIFITGRPERHRRDTEENLRKIGCDGYAALVCAPDSRKGSAADFKAAERKRLTEEGRTIIANMGDQQSDLLGGYSERIFKLPNPFYLNK
jgi:acid phosphatase